MATSNQADLGLAEGEADTGGANQLFLCKNKIPLTFPPPGNLNGSKWVSPSSQTPIMFHIIQRIFSVNLNDTNSKNPGA